MMVTWTLTLLAILAVVPSPAYSFTTPTVVVNTRTTNRIIKVPNQDNIMSSFSSQHYRSLSATRRDVLKLFQAVDDDDTTPSEDPVSNSGSTSSSSTSSSLTSFSSSSSSSLQSTTSATSRIEDTTNSGGIATTLLLAIPLFCKFAIVLIIKFLTDLVVYPLLFLYRGCRVTKRKVLSLFGITTTIKSKEINKNINGKDDNRIGFSSDYQPNGAGSK